MSDLCEHATLDVVLFSAGEWRAGFEARLVRSSRPALANASGKTIETQLGLAPPAGATPRQYLELKRAQDVREVLVGAPVELVTLPASSIYPLPPLLAARCKLHGLRALALEQDAKAVVLLFEPAAV
ncbi:hypothetical protein [Rhodoferax sp.]|uniref:hypothetical protein n=1 Tax=Rhodoferax sp. TaxID=50421 RepID=UPI00283E4662|nr:hypothetical protein [Rhodoferax sp.]MDR3369135.1 hypothetical protein [Rhodoferax sp.]